MYKMDISQGVTCLRFGRMKQKNGWERTNSGVNPTNLLVFVIGGAADFCIDGCVERVEAGQILVIPSGAAYTANTGDFCEYFFFRFTGRMSTCPAPEYPPVAQRSFSFDLMQKVESSIYFPARTVDPACFGSIYAGILACTEYSVRQSHAARLLLDTEFLKILLTLGEHTEMTSRKSNIPPALNNMLMYIKKNLTSQITLAGLCSACRISESYAERLFKKHFGITATEYIHNEKLYYACELLHNTGLNISEIARYLGYGDVFYFSRRFKRKFGVSPTKMVPSRNQQM